MFRSTVSLVTLSSRYVFLIAYHCRNNFVGCDNNVYITGLAETRDREVPAGAQLLNSPLYFASFRGGQSHDVYTKAFTGFPLSEGSRRAWKREKQKARTKAYGEPVRGGIRSWAQGHVMSRG
jgi:hypothetical protein